MSELVVSLCNDGPMPNTGYLASVSEEAWRRVGRAALDRRTEIGISQKEAALGARVSATWWNQLEQGRHRNIQRKNIVAVERFLGWERGSIENLLFEGIEPEVLDEVVEEELENEQVAELKDEIADLKDRVDNLEDFVALVRSVIVIPE